ncbi:MAG: hypothetical protein OEW12_08515, partial [Deltaproteobacteria bacterium]|nr:hypothetical protein [Deltaproteobacteria bacterium]
PDHRFDTLVRFIKEVNLHRVNKRVMEALIRAGAFDSIHPNRAQLIAGLDKVMEMGLAYRNTQVEGQASLFNLLSREEAAKAELVLELPPTPPFRPRERLNLEKQALGFYISGHPMDGYRSEIANITVSTAALHEGESRDGQEVMVAGVVGQTPTVRLNKNSEKWAAFRLEDTRGSVEVVVFSRVYAEAAALLAEDQPLLIQGRVNLRDEEISVSANRVMSLSLFRAEQARRMMIPVEGKVSDERMRRMSGVISKTPGECRVWFEVEAQNGSRVFVDSGLGVSPTEEVVEELEEMLPGVALRFDYPPAQQPGPSMGGGRRPPLPNGKSASPRRGMAG